MSKAIIKPPPAARIAGIDVKNEVYDDQAGMFDGTAASTDAGPIRRKMRRKRDITVKFDKVELSEATKLALIAKVEQGRGGATPSELIGRAYQGWKNKQFQRKATQAEFDSFMDIHLGGKLRQYRVNSFEALPDKEKEKYLEYETQFIDGQTFSKYDDPEDESKAKLQFREKYHEHWEKFTELVLQFLTNRYGAMRFHEKTGELEAIGALKVDQRNHLIYTGGNLTQSSFKKPVTADETAEDDRKLSVKQP